MTKKTSYSRVKNNRPDDSIEQQDLEQHIVDENHRQKLHIDIGYNDSSSSNSNNTINNSNNKKDNISTSSNIKQQKQHIREEEYDDDQDKITDSTKLIESEIELQEFDNDSENNDIESNGGNLTIAATPSSSSSSFCLTLSIIVAVVVIFACIFYFSNHLVSFLEFVKELGFLGNIILVVSFLPTGIPLAIFSYYIPLTLSSGFIYGFFYGFLTVALGSALSASFGFWITRKVSLKWFENKIESSPKLSNLRRKVEQHPFKIIITMRLLPIPFGLQNGLCAMTRISYSSFIYSSIIGLSLENCLIAYIGSTIKTMTDITSNGHKNAFSSFQQIILVVGIVGGILLTCLSKKFLQSPFNSPAVTISTTLTTTINSNNTNNNSNSNDNNHSTININTLSHESNNNNNNKQFESKDSASILVNIKSNSS
ncbi:hypothetical protein CYY_003561 [Polysphondylium violaceum]|uniref:VTT domain-containing protein n=1 Tax=Polysphondylium violaceum TaxID=133409 RepID=A0A8J4PWT5_9MYCE|nr:hypothetical protein CYY_003561 [Polysphondylium violaceum]